METGSEATREILRKVRQVEIRTNRMVTDALAGAYNSIFKGQGMNFEEVREYAPGDDVRNIDWNVTAKMDKPFIKKFREERELTLMIMVDLSASGNFGSVDQSKREIAAELASVLAFSATRNNDKVGLILFTDKIEKFVYPQKGRQHVLRLIRDILYFKPENKKTDINEALSYLNKIVKRNAVVFMLTDFLQDKNGKLPLFLSGAEHSSLDPIIRNLALTSKRHDLTCVSITDPREMTLPKVGIISLEDAETGEQIHIDSHNKHVRERYERFNTARVNALKKGLTQQGIDFLNISTDTSFMKPLRMFMQKRMSRLKR